MAESIHSIIDMVNEAYRLYQAGNRDSAWKACTIVLQHQPSQVDAVYLTAVIAQECGRIDEALTRLRQAVSIAPDNHVYCNALGELLFSSGQSLEARQWFERSAALRPTYERAHNNLGRLCHAAGETSAAVGHFSEAIRLNPRYSTAHNNLGAAYLALGDTAHAAAHFAEALRLQPEYPEARFNLASVLHSQGDALTAVPHVREAIRLRPNYVRAHALLAQLLFDLAQMKDSMVHFEIVVRLQPNDPKAHLRLADVQLLLGQTDSAMAEYNEALRLDPNDAECFAHRFRLKEQTCDWSDRPQSLDRLWSDIVRATEAGTVPATNPFYAASLPWSPKQQLAVARGHARCFPGLKVSEGKPAAQQSKSVSGRLKIGYLSRDFYDHPVGHQCASLFALHDRQHFEVHVYSFSPNDKSVYRQRIEKGVEHFHDVEWTNSAELVRQIRADGIQILVDLMGFTGLARTSVVASRPAPIQVNWLGYPGTMGADFVDYIIGDAVVTPPDFADGYSERIVRMPHSFMITDREQPISERAIKRCDCGLPDEAVVFCAFHSGYKIDPGSFDAWISILREVPGSVLWMSVRDPAGQANLRREAQVRNVDASRLIFAGHVALKADHLARLRLADLFLDARYYNAHASGCDALWAGLPLLTCPAETFASRVGASLLNAVGMPELIASDQEKYVEMAINLGLSSQKRIELRRTLSEKRLVTPLFDTPLFVRNLESAYRQMWAEKL